MKTFFLSAFTIVGLVAANTFGFAQTSIDVYLLGGQSNATGQGYLKNLPQDFNVNTSVLIFHSGRPYLDSGAEPYTWLPLRQASESPDRFGPELGFGNRIKELHPKRNIAIIKHAHSGTNLYAQWNPGLSPKDSSEWGEQFKEFVKTVNFGLDELRKRGYRPKLRAMLWQQGEGDADNLSQSANYGQNLTHFIKRVREQFNAPKLQFVYGYVYPPPTTGEGPANVRKAQYDIAQRSKTDLSVKGAILVKTDDLNHRADDPNSPHPKDHIHFGTLGTLQLGIRMADALFK